jgi:hypothetical protein
MNKLDLKRITAVCIDGRDLSNDVIDSYRVLFNHMLSSANFYDIVFVSKDEIKHEGVKNIRISGFDISGYSSYCVKELNGIVDSDFCLVFQLDGFILNPNLWDEGFYDYDYIGAPWPLHFGGWVSEENQVGNGGFSLRSKKLLEVTQNLPSTSNHEDTYIVFENRDILDENDIKIAPLDIAIKFSVENPIDDSHNIDTCFGFHSKSLLIDALKNKIIR